jgi:hemerythrin
MAEQISWTKQLSVGSDELDNQHKWLIKILNRLASNDLPDDLQFLDHILSELQDYTSTHFRDEERYMIKTDFPDIKEHVELHIRFEKRLVELRQKYINDQDFDKASEIANSLTDWFIQHIKVKDQEYCKHTTGKD